ncbi:ABC transporter ATP-binding protein, partial [Myxococcus sp. AM011]|uniref:ABC transporter C-terminal domain-containing protein n=1 Tax=Myxococcus sp. AM011 TaxID=2745200 RepID=UPI0017A169E1
TALRAPVVAPPPAAKPEARKAVKLSYKDQRELDGMEATIEVAETRKADLEAQLADPTIYSKSGKVAEVQKELDAAIADIDRLYARWQVLQDLAAGLT